MRRKREEFQTKRSFAPYFLQMRGKELEAEEAHITDS
jgi:hypothetical protein